MDSRSRLSKERSLKSARKLSNNSSSRYQRQENQQRIIEPSNLQVKEIYNDILDLREPRYQNEAAFENTLDRSCPSDISNCDVIRQTPKKTCHFSRRFDFTTNIIAERIVSKQFELLQNKKVTETKKLPTPSRIPFRMNKLVAQRIIDVNSKLSGKLQKPAPKTSNRKTAIEVIKEASNNVGSSTSEEVAKQRRSRWKSPTTPSRPRFHLSTKRSSSRIRMSHATVQANLKDPHQSDDTQTDLSTPVRSILTQITPKCLAYSKKTQTRMFKRNHIETSPISFPRPTKYTNTTLRYSSSDQATQFYEYMSRSDLFCLDWVNKHLFEAKMNLNNIIVDEKIKEISEIGTKSTLISNIESGCWME